MRNRRANPALRGSSTGRTSSVTRDDARPRSEEPSESRAAEALTAQPVPGAEDALRRLVSGNQRFVAGAPAHPHQSPQHRTAVTAGQGPFAAILGCSDSRVPPEIIFDQGLGDLFVARVAGHVADRSVLASLEMAVDGLGLHLIVVLGHDSCAAIMRTVEMLGLSAKRPEGGMWNWGHDLSPASTRPIGHLGELAASLKPAVDQAYYHGGDMVSAAVNANISRVVEQLRSSQPILAARVTQAGLRIVGARYNMTSGAVTFTS